MAISPATKASVRTFAENYLDQAREGEASRSQSTPRAIAGKARKYVEKLTEGYEERVAAYYVLKRANGDVDLPQADQTRGMVGIVRRELSWPVLSVTEPWDIPKRRPSEEEGGGGRGRGQGRGRVSPDSRVRRV